MNAAQMPKGSSFSLKMVHRSAGQPTKKQLALLEKIATVAGGELLVDEVGSEGNLSWVKFHIVNQADASVLRKLDQQEHRLYGLAERFRWQITCASHPSNDLRERGLWLHELDTSGPRLEYRSGCWFY